MKAKKKEAPIPIKQKNNLNGSKMKKATEKTTMPQMQESDEQEVVPISEIGVGDEVFSRHHGKGIMESFIDGTRPLRINFDNRSLTYTAAGYYFGPDSAFAEKNPVLRIIKQSTARPGRKEEA